MMTLKKVYEDINSMKKKKKIINNLIEKNDLELAFKKLNEYESMCKYDIDIYSIKSVIYTLQNRVDEAEKILKKALDRKPFNYDLNYNVAMVYYLKKDINRSLDFFVKSIKYANSFEQKDNALASIQELIHNIDSMDLKENQIENIKETIEYINYLTSDSYENVDNRYFPIREKKDEKEFLIGNSFIQKDNDNYYVGFYNYSTIQNYPTELHYKVKTETIVGKNIENKLELNVDKPCAIPILVKDYGIILNIKINDNEYEFKNLVPNRFYYLPIKSTGNISIEFGGEIIVGKKIDLKDNNDVRLSLCMFIDGLSQSVIENENFKKLMPNTYKFFSKGTVFTNFSTNGEWTLPSVASYFTGKYTTNHKLFNPNLNYDIGRDYPLISEIYRENGYLTFQACGNWRKNPAYGYARGFDRTLYQNGAYGGMSCEEVILETIDHLDAFKDRSHFCWLTFNELHKVGDILRPMISSQINNSISSMTLCRNSQKSVVHKYDERKVERYKTEIKRLDRYFKILFDYIEEKFDNEEILITLFSDHGQSYLNNEVYFENEKRIKVPFLIRGAGVNEGYCDEIAESVDVFPTMLRLCNIEQNESIDGQVPKYFGGDKERKYSYTESIYPKKTYKALIDDNKHKFVFETKEICDNDGRVDIIGSSLKLVNKASGIEEQDVFEEKVEEYTKVVLDHIRDHIKI